MVAILFNTTNNKSVEVLQIKKLRCWLAKSHRASEE